MSATSLGKGHEIPFDAERFELLAVLVNTDTVLRTTNLGASGVAITLATEYLGYSFGQLEKD